MRRYGQRRPAAYIPGTPERAHATRRRSRSPGRELQISRKASLIRTYISPAARLALLIVVGVAPVGCSGAHNPASPRTTHSALQVQSFSPTQTTSPTPTDVPTADWIPFTSERFGYTIAHPPGWQTLPSSRPWTMQADGTNWFSPAQDRFIDGPGSIGVHGFAVDLPPSISEEEWIDDFLGCATAGSECATPAADMAAITVDGRAARLVDVAGDSTFAFVFADPAMYVFSIGRPNRVPLFMAFLSTVRFTP
jgi:hypothetical protein